MGESNGKNDEKPFRVNDERHWLNEDADLDALDARAAPKARSYIEELEQRVADMERRAQEYRAEARAETEAACRRLEREAEQQLDVERARLAEPFLEVLDNFERLLEAGLQSEDNPAFRQLVEGAQLVLRQLAKRLGELGIQPVPTENAPFDPKTMEALSTAPVEPEREGLVLQELRRGYLLGERVIRPAGVQVGVAKQG